MRAREILTLLHTVFGFNVTPSASNRRLTDVVAADNAASCLAAVEAFAGLPLLVWGERRLAPEFAVLRFGVGPAPRRALGGASAFELCRNAPSVMSCRSRFPKKSRAVSEAPPQFLAPPAPPPAFSP